MRTTMLATCLLLAGWTTTASANDDGSWACSRTAHVLKNACLHEAKDDHLTEIANCLNDEDQRDCRREAYAEVWEARGECGEVFDARREVCADVGEAPYQPPFGEDFAGQFVDPLEIGGSVAPNPYFPLVPGNYWVYEDDEGEETITVRVTNKTKLIDGITCIVVVDIAEDEGVPVEVTDDWYAQDLDGNVWYCGEISEELETFDGDVPEEPELVAIEGSWKHGRDGAKAGLLLPSNPMVGQVIRQEVAWGDAEDVIEILSLNADEAVTLGDDSELSCGAVCLQTRDYTPIEPDADENKYFLPGTGQILEVDLVEGTRVELKEFGNEPPPPLEDDEDGEDDES